MKEISSAFTITNTSQEESLKGSSSPHIVDQQITDTAVSLQRAATNGAQHSGILT
jgi:hypothetical protein